MVKNPTPQRWCSDEREHQALGAPFPPLAERFERLEETVQIVHQMWSDDVGPYAGKHYQLGATINSPQPLSRPHPPIMIGGGGEGKTLRLVAKDADATNLFRRTSGWAGHGDHPVGGTARTDDKCGKDSADQMARYADVGVEEVHVMPYGPDPGFIRGLGSHVIPAVAGL
jgi:hypothetical protein